MARNDCATALLLLAPLIFAMSPAAAAKQAAPVVQGPGCPNIANGVLAMHNKLRWQHRAPLLAWDAGLAAKAQAHANTCKWGHSSGRKLAGNGESIFYSGGMRYPFRGMDVCTWATYALSLEVTVYNFNAPGESRDPAVSVGHFVNIVWGNTTRLGCGYAACPGKDYVVCWYGPGFYASGGSTSRAAGFAANVRRTRCQEATRDDWCAACAGAGCRRCHERPQYGQPMGRHKIYLDLASRRCVSKCPSTVPGCQKCGFDNACVACKAGWRKDGLGRCILAAGRRL